MIQYGILSKAGDRDHNEDSVSVSCDQAVGCFALADGLGGHGKGEVASDIAVRAVTDIDPAEYQTNDVFLERSFEKAQENLLLRQKEDSSCADMKTTLVTLVVGKQQCQWAHVGDSRLYYFENNKMKSRTLDHSVPQMLVAVGDIQESEIRYHPDRNRLLHVLGEEEEDEEGKTGCTLETPVTRIGRQAFLLCSDGFWELIEDKEMESLLKKSETPDQWLQKMENIVLENGKNTDMDNYSAVAVWVDYDQKSGFSWRLPWKWEKRG